MADQFPADDLTSHHNRRETYRFAALIAHCMDEKTLLAPMCALVKVFAGACEFADVDPEAAFSQILDAEQSGALAVDPDERAELLPTLLKNH